MVELRGSFEGEEALKSNSKPGKTNKRGRLSTVDLLVPTSLDQLISYWEYYLSIYKTGYLNKEVNCTEPSPSVSIPWANFSPKKILNKFNLKKRIQNKVFISNKCLTETGPNLQNFLRLYFTNVCVLCLSLGRHSSLVYCLWAVCPENWIHFCPIVI